MARPQCDTPLAHLDTVELILVTVQKWKEITGGSGSWFVPLLICDPLWVFALVAPTWVLSLCSSFPPLLGALFNGACLPGFHHCVGTWSFQWQQRLLWRYGSFKWLTPLNTHLLFFSTLIEGGPEHIIFIGWMIRLSLYVLHKYIRVSPSVEIPHEGKMWNLLPRQAGHP